MAAIQLPKGLVKLPWVLTEKTTGIVLRDGTANVETEIVLYQIPRNMGVGVKAGNRFYLRLRTAVPATITAGMVRMYVADANKATKFKVLEAPPSALNANDGQTWNREAMHFIQQAFSRESDEYLVITYEGASVVEADNTEIILEGTQVIKI